MQEPIFVTERWMYPVEDQFGNLVAFTLKYEEATHLTESIRHSARNRVLVRVEGGQVQGASADDPSLQVIVIDADDLDAGSSLPFTSDTEYMRVLSEMHPVY